MTEMNEKLKEMNEQHKDCCCLFKQGKHQYHLYLFPAPEHCVSLSTNQYILQHFCSYTPAHGTLIPN